jgi:hypothetical protein|tara:strand:- start:79 stop:474 length:396 start_codon:yes stop_codon:yes gene_type:complete
MGMYTELIFGAELKSDTPIDVINTLKYLVGDIDIPSNLLYTEDRNPLMGGSYYFGVNTSVTKMYFDGISDAWVLSSRANIKNYGNEIETFLEWIKPFISQGSGNREMYAIVIYEDQEIPSIYYLNDGDNCS